MASQVCASSLGCRPSLRAGSSRAGVFRGAQATGATKAPLRPSALRQPRHSACRAASGDEPSVSSATDIELDADSEMAKKMAAADALREQEKFMMIGTGEADCKGCGYTYTPKAGDPEYPISPGTKFEDLPADWQCPVCGAERTLFVSKSKEVAGFAANQGYGLGTNTMTGEQKSLLIYGSLLAFFALFLAGYTME